MIYAKLLDLVKKRRSIRRFKTDPVSDELILQILEIARWAPSGFNMQPWEFVVVKESELRTAIVKILSSYWEQSKDMEQARPEWQGRKWKLTGMTDTTGDFSEAPVYILVFGDTRSQAGLPMGVQCDNHRRFLIHQSGLANAFLYMHLATTALGLASQWLSAVQTPYASCLIKDLLGIPESMEVYDMMALGYPGIAPPGKYMRHLSDVVHWGKQDPDNFRTDEEVKDFVYKSRSWTIGTHSRKKK